MNRSSHLKFKSDLIVYPSELIGGERKRLLLLVVVSLLFTICGCWIVITSQQLLGWAVLFFFGSCFLTFLTQLSWGPLLRLNEEGIRIRSNPLIRRVMVQWSEIAAITLSNEPRGFYLGIALAPDQVDAFLQRQPPLTRRILARKLKRFQVVARFSQTVLPYSMDRLVAAMRERYHTQIQQYSIFI